MAQPLTVLALTPSIGGYFYGELIAGLTREIVGAGARLVIVQTLEAGTNDGEVGEAGAVGDFATPVAWSQVDGVVSLNSAVCSSYLQQLRDAGKPVVLTTAASLSFAAPLVRPDNTGGTFSAVEHLIGHGHTRIGFVGNFTQPDVLERYEGYVQALHAHHLTADPALVFAAHKNTRSGGVLAARALLDSTSRPTAVMAATDRNAIGFMATLIEAGVAVPRDIAVIGFDNAEAAAFNTPALSSVNQRFDEIGALAGRLVLAEMRGEVVPYETFSPKSIALATRESCGCSTARTDIENGRGDSAPAASSSVLRDELQDALYGALLTGQDGADRSLHAAVLAVVSEADRLLGSGDRVTNSEIQALTASLSRLGPQPDVLRRITFALTDYVQRSITWASEGRGGEAPNVSAARLTAALWQLQAGVFLRQAEAAEVMLDTQLSVDARLLDTSSSDPRKLDWLASTHVRAGVLALWEDDPSSGRLRVAGTYDTAGLLPSLVDTIATPEGFPPSALISMVEPAEREACIVVPVSTTERDWGLLAVVGGESTTTATRKSYQHWAGLLCASLESHRLQEAVRKSALFDALTGLPNRELFVRQLEHALALWHRAQTPFAVLFLDLDGFKLINDSLGHQMGDRVLIAVGSDIARELRSVDTGARFGGDEFVILLTDTNAAGALVVAQRVQASLAEAHDFEGHEIVTRVSIGIATSAIDYSSAEEVLHDADTAMYRAKSTEPGTVAFFDAPMHVSALLRASLARELHLGLRENQFDLHYQPIVNLVSGRTDRFEALVRWRHPERGQLLPDEFLPAMEETGLIVQLGHWVITEVCRQLVEWGPEVVNVSINISDKEFWSQDLLTRVLATLQLHNLAPDRLTLEITEGVLMRRPELALRTMKKMHEAGLRLHIDDFGTGYSSLETLHRFPVDAFKIDRSFIRTMASSENSVELISALVKLGKALGIAVVAEGVETAEQLEFLQEIGCATGQGYLFMPAVAGDRVADLLGHSLHADTIVVTP